MNDILVASAIIGNLVLFGFLLFRGWVGRLQWFTLMTGIAIPVECLAAFVHGFDHHLYEPMRIFLIYLMFPMWEALCAWEAWRVGVRWLEQLMLVQVGIQVVALLAHLHGDRMGVYRIEIFADYVDVAGIILSIWMFRWKVSIPSNQAQ